MKPQKVVTLRNVVEEAPRAPSRNLTRRACWFAAKVALLIGASGYLYLQAAAGVEWAKAQAGEWYAWGLDRMTIEKRVVEVQASGELSLEETIGLVAGESGISPLVFEVIAHIESSSGRFVYHFEPELYERLRGNRKYEKFSSDEVRMLASSHGDFHVLGLTGMQQCGLKPHELYDRVKAARCVAKILAALDQRNRDTKDRGERLRLMLTGFNGSGEAAAKYAERAMGMIGERLYSRLLS